MKKNNSTVLLVGSGGMAVEYAKILKALQVSMLVAGRGAKSAKIFEKETGINVLTNGVENVIKGNKERYQKAIVAVDGGQLGFVCKKLLQTGIKSILLEKPGGLDFKEINQLDRMTKKYNAIVYVAYNRRHYVSVQKVREIIRGDGGILSFNFEFTEWSHVIEKLDFSADIKEKWFLHNSTHLVDLAFFLAGQPVEISSCKSGKLSWHPSGAIYTGSGKTEQGSLFSYQANWVGPGRWGLEIITRKRRLILRPLEELREQKIGSNEVTVLTIDDAIDKKFKPGLYRQVKNFLDNQTEDFCTIHHQSEASIIYKKIAGNG